MHHSTGRRDRFPSPVHLSTGRRDWFPSPVHYSTGRRDRFPSPLHHGTGRSDLFPSLVHHCTGQRDWLPCPVYHSKGRRDRYAIELSCPSFWGNWASRDMFKHILTLPVGFYIESQSSWKCFKPNHYPPQLTDLIHRAPWGKISTEDRIQPLTQHVMGCPTCVADEDNLYFLFHCSSIKVAADCIHKTLGSYIDVHGISHSILRFLLEQVSGLEFVEGCQNFDSHSDGEPHEGGRGWGERPCTPPPPLYPRVFWSLVSVSCGATSLPRLASQTLNFEFGFD